MDSSVIDVSVYITSYKQQKYIRKCLDTIVSQKFSGTFEIVVCDDCSNDGTDIILEEYKRKFPNLFTIIIQEKNVGLSKNSFSAEKVVRGKYLCPVEADDFWTDDYRLQKQFDFLENHPEYVAVACNHYYTSEEGKIIKPFLFPWQVNKRYDLKSFNKHGFVYHGNTVMYRNILPRNNLRYDEIRVAEPTMVDLIVRMFLHVNGLVYVMKDIMHAHRDGELAVTSFSHLSKTKSIQYSYMFNRIVDNVNSFYDNKYDWDSLKACRASHMLKLKYFFRKKIYLPKEEFNSYFKSLSFKIRLLSYCKMINLLFKKMIRSIYKVFNSEYRNRR